MADLTLITRLLALCLTLVASQPAAAQSAPCRQALVLALDVSGSVNDLEYQQQINGLSDALDSDEVRALLLGDVSAPVHIAVFEWSSQNHQSLIQNWTVVTSPQSLDRLIDAIRSHNKQRQGLRTAIGRAMEFAVTLMSERASCWRQTIDVSGDGENNIGPLPRAIYALPAYRRITVNALVVGDPAPSSGRRVSPQRSKPELRRYFEEHVVHGPGGFSLIAKGYEDYARAMRLKLKRELADPVFGELRPHRSMAPL